MTKKQKAIQVVQRIKDAYPDPSCCLIYTHPYELLIAVRLSAQCTDARVNIVTKTLFSKYPTLDSLAQAEYNDIYAILKPCGLGKTKANDTINMCKILIETHNRILPNTIEELTKLPGIGRKTANLIMGDIYGQPAIVCDTHCIRITNHIGLSTSTNPLIVERELKAILPPSESSDFCHRMVLHGRAVCKARSPVCELCCVNDLCNDYKKQNNK